MPSGAEQITVITVDAAMIKKWDNLPDAFKNDQVYPYYQILSRKKFQLAIKRMADFAAALLLLILLIPVFLVISALIAIDSQGPVIFKQTRVTQYGRLFTIYKFRTMTHNTDKICQVTTKSDPRITRMGRFLRKYRLDELPQLWNIVLGDMSFVGTRPEVVKYVQHYTGEMMATLLLPAGVTSEASIRFRDEAELLSGTDNADAVYLREILPKKMKLNLQSLENFGLLADIRVLLKTVWAVFKD